MNFLAYDFGYSWPLRYAMLVPLILAGILAAVIPVCGGINLEYYFSRVDNTVYGCGTKLPHNVCGMLGVMNGIDDDLRTGLPSQMMILERGFARLRYHATWQTRSYGPGGQRYGATGITIA